MVLTYFCIFDEMGRYFRAHGICQLGHVVLNGRLECEYARESNFIVEMFMKCCPICFVLSADAKSVGTAHGADVL